MKKLEKTMKFNERLEFQFICKRSRNIERIILFKSFYYYYSVSYSVVSNRGGNNFVNLFFL